VSAACAAASRATGTRNGEQSTFPSGVSRPQMTSDLNQPMQIALIFLKPFLFERRVFFQRAIVRGVFFAIWLHQLAEISARYLFESERRVAQSFFVQRACTREAFFLPPAVQTRDLFPHAPMFGVPSPIDDFVGMLLLDEIYKQLKNRVQKNFVLIAPALFQSLNL
jgi:hypothetical protein